MKLVFTFLMLLLSVSAQATVTINITFGIARDVDGVEIEDGTLWALIVDGGDGNITGINVGSGNGGSFHDVANPDSFFLANQNLGVGSDIGNGDTVFAMGGMDSSTTGLTGSTFHELSGLTLGTSGLVAGRAYAIYWFPGIIYSGGESPSISGHSQQIGSQVGGISSIVNDGSYAATLIPSDGGSADQGASSADYDSGRWTTAQFTAVQLIPEPASALLAMLGGLTLVYLRRRVEGC